MDTECTILRTMRVGQGTLNIATGEPSQMVYHTETRRCGTPLFREDHKARGVCASCARGWSVEDNRFANDAEQARALLAKMEGR